MKYTLNGKEVTREEWLAGSPGVTPGCPPQVVTDATFMRGTANGAQFEKTPYIGDGYKKLAARHGVNVKGKKYFSSLARFPGDPEAWVDSRGDVARLIAKRGWKCDGSVKVNAIRNDQEPEQVGLADDIVQDEVAKVLADHPEPQKVNVGELAHTIREKRTPHWAKRRTPKKRK